MIRFSWDDVYSRVKAMNLGGIKVWGIPRGGAIVAGLTVPLGAIVVDDPSDAQVALDDIIDSGSTSQRVAAEYKLDTLALIDKPKEGITEWVHLPWEEPPKQDIEESVRRIFQWLGEDAHRDGLKETPARVVASWEELYKGYNDKPEQYLKWFCDDTDEMIISKNINFYSFCEHHMLPFFGTVSIGYIPKGYVLGISKMSRIVNTYARRLQIQERLTRQVGELLNPYVNGIAVHTEAQHFCMMARGVNQQNSTLITNYLTGPFREKPEARAEFLAAVTNHA